MKKSVKKERIIRACGFVLAIGMLCMPGIAGLVLQSPAFATTSTLGSTQNTGWKIVDSEAEIGASVAGIEVPINLELGTYEKDQLGISLELFVDNTANAGDLSSVNLASSYVAVNSSGQIGAQELVWTLDKMNIQPGWNELTLLFQKGKHRTQYNTGMIDTSSIVQMVAFVQMYGENSEPIKIATRNAEIFDASEVVQMPSFFSDGMLFQQNKPIKIWGKAGAGSELTAKLLREGKDSPISQQTVTAGEDRKWSAEFEPLEASYDKYRIEVYEEEQLVYTISDVLIGELWLASGQSNMEWQLKKTVGAEEFKEGDASSIRVLMEPTYASTYDAGTPVFEEMYDVPEAVWANGSDWAKVAESSAIGYGTMYALQQKLDIPVGFINSAVGGSSLEAWMSKESIDASDGVKKYLTDSARYVDAETGLNLANVGTMSSMYNRKIAPLKGLSISGVLWYQGEANVADKEGFYTEALETMICDWSQSFGFEAGSLPFVFTQIAPHAYAGGPQLMATLNEQMVDVWKNRPESRAIVGTYDLSNQYTLETVVEADSTASAEKIMGADGTLEFNGKHPIHPTDKKPLTDRFANAAYNLVYAEDEYTSPVMSTTEFLDNKAIITFEHVGDGLISLKEDSEDEVQGFCICGEDRVFVGAKAKIIDDDKVEVWSDFVENPQAVTYAFASFDKKGTLAAKTGFSALPFRTDREKSEYFPPHDWMFCDGDVWTGSDIEAGFAPIWRSVGNNEPADANEPTATNEPIDAAGTTITYDSDEKVEGAASLKVEYNAVNVAESTLIEPIQNYTDMEINFGLYKVLSFEIKNPDDRAKILRVKMVSEDGKNSCYLKTISGEKEAQLKEGEDFKQQKFSFVNALNCADNSELSDDEVEKITNKGQLQVEIVDAQPGCVYIDDFQIGIKDGVKVMHYSPILKVIVLGLIIIIIVVMIVTALLMLKLIKTRKELAAQEQAKEEAQNEEEEQAEE